MKYASLMDDLFSTDESLKWAKVDDIRSISVMGLKSQKVSFLSSYVFFHLFVGSVCRVEFNKLWSFSQGVDWVQKKGLIKWLEEEEDFRAFALIGAGVTGLLSFSTVASADEAEHGLESPNYPWPHDQGRGKVTAFLNHYSNESAARFAYGGAYPPDLSLITEVYAVLFASMCILARHNGQNYVFALLTEYGDGFSFGFMTVCAEMGFKWIFLLSLALLQAAYYRRLKWSVLKSRKLVLDVVN
ncbi:hypothetical protein N665_0552s0001 [Sinapis alba]|nr:hypothetical protein N665_0552s0001 [Sinapis alba]